MSKEILTTNLAEFGYREIKLARELLDAWVDQGLPIDFGDAGVHLMMNRNSGNVFLTNEEFQVALMNGDKLESWYTCPECGNEGFKEGLIEEAKGCCVNYIKELLS